MAEKRMLSKVISISEKVNSLPDVFSMLLYTWLIPHTDDFGRLTGSPAKIKGLIIPMMEEYNKDDVEIALGNLRDSGLITWYEVSGNKYIQLTNFEEHQTGLHKKTASKLPPPPKLENKLTYDMSLSASESDIEELLTEKIESNKLLVDDMIMTVERQLRVQNSYLDIVATGRDKYIFEVKRQRLSNSSLEQILKYREMLGESSKCILVGYGVSGNFDFTRAKAERVNVVVYNDRLELSQMLLIDVKCRELTLLTEEKRTELNRTEEKGTRTEQNCNTDDCKERLRKLTIECGLKGVGIDGLETIYSYIGQVDIEVIEKALKKAEKKHVGYFVTILNGMIEEGKTTAESINPKPKGGDPPNGRNQQRDNGISGGIAGKSLTEMFTQQ